MSFKRPALAATAFGVALACASASSAATLVFDITLNNVVEEVNSNPIASTPVNIQYQETFTVALPPPDTALTTVINTSQVHYSEYTLNTPLIGSSSSMSAQFLADAHLTDPDYYYGYLNVSEVHAFLGFSYHSNDNQIDEYISQSDFSDDGTTTVYTGESVTTNMGFRNEIQDPNGYIGDLPTMTVADLGSYLSQFTFGIGIDASYDYGEYDDSTDIGPYNTHDLIYYGTATLDVAASNFVPEPATWALMILGLGAAGAALRRRRLAPVAQA